MHKRTETNHGKNRTQNLSGTWKLVPDPENKGREERWYENYPEDKALDAPVPGIIQQVFPGYHGVAWYCCRFKTMIGGSSDSRYFLKFEEVDYYAQVWLNGVPVGSHEGAEISFELEVSDVLKFDGENLLVVRVLNPIDEAIDGFILKETPHRFKTNTDYMPGTLYNFGGIMKALDLSEVNPVRILDVYAKADIEERRIEVSVTVQNDYEGTTTGRITVSAGLRNVGQVLSRKDVTAITPVGKSTHQIMLPVDQPRLWSIEDPQLYRVTVDLDMGTDSATYSDQRTVNCGFRDFRVENGYFRLNGKRILLRFTIMMNHFAIGQQVPQNPDLLRRDLIHVKAGGFNAVRFIAGGAYSEQLDLCDEIGLMVYDEFYAGWFLLDSPMMAERYDSSMLGVVLRDRNHPSVVMWGLLNETREGPVFRHAHGCLKRLRELDDSRVVLLSSGRWDGQISTGSVSNPKSTEWEPVWGAETDNSIDQDQDTGKSDNTEKGEIVFIQEDNPLKGAEGLLPGDLHIYLKEDKEKLKTIGHKTKPIFLSETGVGSLLDVVDGLRKYEQTGLDMEFDDKLLFRKQVDKFMSDWEGFGLQDVYPFPEDMFIDSYRQQAQQLLHLLNVIRSNPQICGYGMTGIADEIITGWGVTTFWRELKPGIMETLRDGWAPLRWCMFVEPAHGYTGRDFEFEVVLANEDVLMPGMYPVQVKVCGPEGAVWEKEIDLHIPKPGEGEDGLLAISLLRESITLDVQPGVYELAARMERGGAPVGGRLKFYVSEPSYLHTKCDATLLGVEKKAEEWLNFHGISCLQFSETGQDATELILVGNLSGMDTGIDGWAEILQRIARGSTAVFLSPSAFTRGEESVGWLPLCKKGRCYRFHDWVYHKECVVKAHPIFEGLQAKGVMNWDYYEQVIPQYIFDGQDTPDEVVAAAFATGYNDGTLGEYEIGYAAGLLFAGFRFGHGRFFINTFPILENLDIHPTADRMLINIIKYFETDVNNSLAPIPNDFEKQLDMLYKS